MCLTLGAGYVTIESNHVRMIEKLMNTRHIQQILSDNDYIRTAGSQEEKRCAAYLRAACEKMGLFATVEQFSLPSYREEEAFLSVEGYEIPCRGRLGSPNAEAVGRLYYLSSLSETALRACRDRIVLTERPVGQELYGRLILHGARGIISATGDSRDSDCVADSRPIVFLRDALIPWVTVHISHALELVRSRIGANTVLRTRQTVDKGSSQNVLLDLPGACEETVVLSAHYDSTSLSRGAYDNLSGCIALLYLAKRLSALPLRRRVRFLWCGAEEWGLLGSLAYCEMHRAEAPSTVLNINLDMLGCVMGEFSAFSSADEETAEVLERFGARRRFPLSARHGIRSSDSNSFVRAGIPAISFARYAPGAQVQIHTPRDTMKEISQRQLLRDAEFIAKFTEFAVNDADFCKNIRISEKIRGEVETYFKGKL